MEKYFVKNNNESHSIFLIPIDDSFINNTYKYNDFKNFDWDSDSNKTNNTSNIGEDDGEIYSSNSHNKFIFTENMLLGDWITKIILFKKYKYNIYKKTSKNIKFLKQSLKNNV